jgi:hydroxyacylglutathione hydrolase
MINITAIPALRDNYIWAIHDRETALVVDPGEAQPVFAFLAEHALQLGGILCTHRHADHTGGIAELRGVYNVPVYGRRHPANPHITHDLHEGDKLKLEAPDIQFSVLEVPGHLDDHLAFISGDALFCGDVLFGAGCGRNFEGSLSQLHQSLEKLAALPGTTQVYCAHEYTQANLRFALACEPGNPRIRERITETLQLRAAGQPSVPSSIALEKATNPFLRCDSPELIGTLKSRGLPHDNALAVFSALRQWRNDF